MTAPADPPMANDSWLVADCRPSRGRPMRPPPKLDVYPPDVQLNTKLRPAVVYRGAHAARRRDARRHGPGQGHAGRPGPGAVSRETRCFRWPTAPRRWRRVRRANRHAAGHGEGRRGRSGDQLSTRRDAGLHAGRLQHRQLPRRGPRQGRLPPLAVRLRPRRRLLPPHARDRRSADQPGAARRQPAAAEGRRARCRTPAASGSTPTATYYQTLLRWLESGVPNDPPEVRHGRGARNSIRPRRCWKAKGRRSSSSPGPTTPTAPTAT